MLDQVAFTMLFNYPANVNALVHRVHVGHQDRGDLHDHVHDLFQIWDYHHELQLHCVHLWASHSSSSWGCHQWGGSPGGVCLAAGSICNNHISKYKIKLLKTQNTRKTVLEWKQKILFIAHFFAITLYFAWFYLQNKIIKIQTNKVIIYFYLINPYFNCISYISLLQNKGSSWLNAGRNFHTSLSGT